MQVVTQPEAAELLSVSPRAMVAANVANMTPGKPSDSYSANLPNKVSQPEAAKMLNVSDRSIRSAKAVQQKAAPELIEQVTQGHIAVSTAAVIRSVIDSRAVRRGQGRF